MKKKLIIGGILLAIIGGIVTTILVTNSHADKQVASTETKKASQKPSKEVETVETVTTTPIESEAPVVAQQVVVEASTVINPIDKPRPTGLTTIDEYIDYYFSDIDGDGIADNITSLRSFIQLAVVHSTVVRNEYFSDGNIADTFEFINKYLRQEGNDWNVTRRAKDLPMMAAKNRLSN